MGFAQNDAQKSTMKTKLQGCRSTSVCKGACHQISQPEFNPQNPHGGKKERTSVNCPVTSTPAPKLTHMCIVFTHPNKVVK